MDWPHIFLERWWESEVSSRDLTGLWFPRKNSGIIIIILVIMLIICIGSELGFFAELYKLVNYIKTILNFIKKNELTWHQGPCLKSETWGQKFRVLKVERNGKTEVVDEIFLRYTTLNVWFALGSKVYLKFIVYQFSKFLHLLFKPYEIACCKSSVVGFPFQLDELKVCSFGMIQIRIGGVIWDHSDHGTSNEPMNPLLGWTHWVL